jgi:hypothetical protein
LFIYEFLANGCADSSMQQVGPIAQQASQSLVTHEPRRDQNAVDG